MASGHHQTCSDGLCDTSLDTNRLVIFTVAALTGVAAFIFVEESASYLTGGILFTIYTDIRRLGTVIAVVSALLLCVVALGVYGTYWRRKPFIKAFMFVAFLIVLVQYTLASFLFAAKDSDQLQILGESQFKQGWINTIAWVVSGEDTNGEARTFITNIQSSGGCCGYDDNDDPTQNPVDQIPCAFPDTCKEYFQVYVADSLGPVCVGYVTLNSIVLLLLLLSCGVTCMIIPKPSVTYTDGAYYKAAPKQLL